MLVGGNQVPPAEILALLDRYLDYHAARTNQQRANPLNRTSTPSVSAASSNYSYVWVGGGRRRVGSSIPTSTTYFDSQATSLLQTAFEQFRQKDLVSDLIKHLDERAAKAAAADKIYADLAAETGGTTVALLPTETLGSQLRRTVDTFRSSYVLTYTPTGVTREGAHALEVRVQRPLVEVRARRGYVVR